MFSLRPAAARLLSASSTSTLLAARSRNFVTLTPAILRRINQQPPSTRFSIIPRRWNSDAPKSAEEGQAKSENRTVESAIESATGTAHIEEAAQGVVVEENTRADEIAAAQAEGASHDILSDISEASQSLGGSTPGSSALPEADPTPVADSSVKARETPFTPKETVYVGNLFFDVTADDLKTQFEQYGVVESAKIISDGRGLSKGFGYVTFDSIEAASRAIEAMHMQIYEGRRVVVNFAAAPAPGKSRLGQPTKTVFIGNLSHDMTDADLNELFTSVKNVVDVRVAIDRETGKPRGFAHADFLDVQSAQAAVEYLKNKAPYGRKLRVDYSDSNKRAIGGRGRRSQSENGSNPAADGY